MTATRDDGRLQARAGKRELEKMQKRIELPRSLESYFAFAESERGRDCRRFSITLPYLDHGRMDKLQWWWRVGTREEALLGEAGLEARRRREIERFLTHVDRWLANNGRRLYGEGPFPCIAAMPAAEEAAPVPAPDDEIARDKVANA